MKFHFLIVKSSVAALVLAALAVKLSCHATEVLVAANASSVNTTNNPVSLLCAHAHNDYEHTRPLFDALAEGFGSVEPDIWLVDGKLLVAHDLADVKPERTLRALYLEPLRERIRRNGGRVFPNEATFTLLVDIKSGAEPTYAALEQELLNYQDLLTSYTATNTLTNLLRIILSGNRPIGAVAAQPVRYVTIDGRLTDLQTNLPSQLVPLISENWNLHFKWRGAGVIPADEKTQLHQLVERVHREGRQVRFWANPDNLAGWRELRSAGVDVIGTDDLSGLARFLRAETQ